ncbi:MAG: hypothetical protein K2W95_16865 [Candidatus Obscuribacterales bacterium]|nr:hypothetical protein [Candidatus Obscuribacterales bacterium]
MRDQLFHQSSRNRKEKGNMLVLSGMFLLAASIAVILAMSFAALMFTYNRLQTTADELAIEGARKLNEVDRIGQMNNMIARSRQLVFASRKQAEEAGHYPQLIELADKLLEQSRDGALELENQRKVLRSVNASEVQEAVTARFNQLKGRHLLVLPWIKVGIPQTPVVKLGYIDQVQSNVAVLEGLEGLESSDHSPAVSDNQSALYEENINPHLPGADGDLHFKMCSLPAQVENTIAPARATLANSFRTAPDDHLQSAVQIDMSLEVETMLGATAGGKFKAIGTALATGASNMQ